MTPTPAPSPRAHFYVTPAGRCSPHPRGAIYLAAMERKKVTLAPMPYGAFPRIPAHLAAMAMEGR